MTNLTWYTRMISVSIVSLAYCWLIWELTPNWKWFMAVLWGTCGVMFFGILIVEDQAHKRKVKRFKHRIDRPEFGRYAEDDPREDR